MASAIIDRATQSSLSMSLLHKPTIIPVGLGRLSGGYNQFPKTFAHAQLSVAGRDSKTVAILWPCLL